MRSAAYGHRLGAMKQSPARGRRQSRPAGRNAAAPVCVAPAKAAVQYPKYKTPLEISMQFIKKNFIALFFATLFTMLIVGGVVTSL